MAAAGCYHKVVKVVYGGYLVEFDLLHLTKEPLYYIIFAKYRGMLYAFE